MISLRWPRSTEHCEHCSYRSNFFTSKRKWIAENRKVQHFGIRHSIWRRLLCEGEIWPTIRQESIRIKTSQKIMKTTWTNVGRKHMLRLNLQFFFLMALQLFYCVSYENTHKQYYTILRRWKKVKIRWSSPWACSHEGVFGLSAVLFHLLKTRF